MPTAAQQKSQATLQQKRMQKRRDLKKEDDTKFEDQYKGSNFKSRKSVFSGEKGVQIQDPAKSPPRTVQNTSYSNENLAKDELEQQKDAEFRQKLNRDRLEHMERSRMFQQLPAEISPKMNESETAQIAQAQREYAQAQNRLQNPIEGVARRKAEKLKKQAKEKVKTEAKLAVKKFAKKTTKDWGWRIFGRGSVVEFEGAAGWSWFITGFLTSTFQLIKTIFMKKDVLPEDSLLSFFEPTRLDFQKNPAAWIDAIYGIVALLAIFLIFGLVNIVIIIIVMPFALGAEFFSLFGSFGETITSWLSLLL